MNPELVAALYSLKEDAAYAHRVALEGDLRGLAALGRSMKLVEQLVMEEDAASAVLQSQQTLPQHGAG